MATRGLGSRLFRALVRCSPGAKRWRTTEWSYRLILAKACARDVRSLDSNAPAEAISRRRRTGDVSPI